MTAGCLPLGRGVGDAADDPVGRDVALDGAVRVERLEPPALERPGQLLEEPPGHAVLDRDDDRALVVQRLQPIGDRGDLVRLQRQDDDVLRSEGGQVV